MVDIKIVADFIYYEDEPVARIIPHITPSLLEDFKSEISVGDIQCLQDTIKLIEDGIEERMRRHGCNGLATAEEIVDMVKEILKYG